MGYSMLLITMEPISLHSEYEYVFFFYLISALSLIPSSFSLNLLLQSHKPIFAPHSLQLTNPFLLGPFQEPNRTELESRSLHGVVAPFLTGERRSRFQVLFSLSLCWVSWFGWILDYFCLVLLVDWSGLMDLWDGFLELLVGSSPADWVAGLGIGVIFFFIFGFAQQHFFDDFGLRGLCFWFSLLKHAVSVNQLFFAQSVCWRL